MTDVLNLATRQHIPYTCSPREAVIAAHAQARGDWNTWDYEKRYGHLVTEGRRVITCGDFTAIKES